MKENILNKSKPVPKFRERDSADNNYDGKGASGYHRDSNVSNNNDEQYSRHDDEHAYQESEEQPHYKQGSGNAYSNEGFRKGHNADAYEQAYDKKQIPRK